MPYASWFWLSQLRDCSGILFVLLVFLGGTKRYSGKPDPEQSEGNAQENTGISLTGGNFWEGAATGFVVSMLNHFAHKKPDPTRLKKRIEKDGKLTLKEANKWYRYGKGNSLSIDASKIDLNFLRPDEWVVNGEVKSVQTLIKSKDGLVYGNLSVEYMGNNQTN